MANNAEVEKNLIAAFMEGSDDEILQSPTKSPPHTKAPEQPPSEPARAPLVETEKAKVVRKSM